MAGEIDPPDGATTSEFTPAASGAVAHTSVGLVERAPAEARFAPTSGTPADAGHAQPSGTSCTAPQLRRFIKSRPYVPMHELRRRFAINGGDDDVTAVDLAGGRVYVGLPAREGGLLGELLRGGEVGFELSMDPRSPIVVGLYPMRPIPRP